MTSLYTTQPPVSNLKYRRIRTSKNGITNVLRATSTPPPTQTKPPIRKRQLQAHHQTHKTSSSQHQVRPLHIHPRHRRLRPRRILLLQDHPTRKKTRWVLVVIFPQKHLISRSKCQAVQPLSPHRSNARTSSSTEARVEDKITELAAMLEIPSKDLASAIAVAVKSHHDTPSASSSLSGSAASKETGVFFRQGGARASDLARGFPDVLGAIVGLDESPDVL
jgi:hypothetical protein